MKVKINQKMILLVAVLALFVFYLWSRSISKYSSSGISSNMSPIEMSPSVPGSFVPPPPADSYMAPSSYMGPPAPSSYMGPPAPSSYMGPPAPSSYMAPSAAPSSYMAPSAAPSSYMAPSAAPSSSGTGSYLDSIDSIYGMGIDSEELGYAELDADFSAGVKQPDCSTGSGVGLASSLLPREVAKVENFGDFAPDDILKGQNFLDTRNQIGFPETIGGNIRNGNLQIRADPPNPKQPYVWNNSTIVPDLMQRDLCS